MRIFRNEATCIISAAILLRLIAAIYSTGFNHPDEHFQIIEPAYGLVHDYWLKTWEWHAGIRSWFPAWSISYIIRMAHWIGLSHPDGTAMLIRIFIGLLSVGTVWASYNVALVLGGAKAARLAGWSIALWPGLIYFNVHPLSETLCIPFAMVALVLCILNKYTWLAGVCAAIAFAFRFQAAFFVISCCLILAFNKNCKSLVRFILCGLIVCAFVMILDCRLWQQLIYPAWRYFKFNVIEGGASREFGVAPMHRYITALSRHFTAPVAIVLMGFSFSALYGFRKNWPVWVFVLPFIVSHHLISHKEDRFIVPIFPALIVLASIGATQVKMSKKLKILLISIVIMSGIYRGVTWKWQLHADASTLLTYIGRQPDLSGVLMCNVSVFDMGGAFYVGKNITWTLESDSSKCK
ncbi:MAG: hypothetical protein HY843_07015, partial [Bdellovibrio sp.]|nr:hypothetical protein [Bdellovibrio sp.]